MKNRKVVLWIILVVDIFIIIEAGLFIWKKLQTPKAKPEATKVVEKRPPVLTPEVVKKPAEKPKAVAKKKTISSKPVKPKVAQKPKVAKPKKKEKPKPVEPAIKKLSTSTTVTKKKKTSKTPPQKKTVTKKTETTADIIRSRGDLIFGFETTLQGWEIPDWALEKDDHVAKSATLSREHASEGQYSLKLVADFPGGGAWTAALIEVMEYFDWSTYSVISVDVYIPEGATNKLKGEIIFTVGEDWTWTEMSRTTKLKTGEWTTIKANMKPGSKTWRRYKPDDEFRADVRKVAIRIASDKFPVYNGPIYIDNIRLIK